jgi:hypothetical protein
VINIKIVWQIVLIVPLTLVAVNISAGPCEDKELWFETGVGFYSNGYSLEGTEKRTRSLYRKMKGEPLTEEVAVATALQAWRHLDENKVSTNIGQIERVMLAQRYYAQCLAMQRTKSQDKIAH